MKFLKLLVSLLTVFSVIFFVGCGSSDDGTKANNNPFVGTWIEIFDDGSSQSFVFKSNETGTATFEDLVKIITVDFTYKVDKNTTTLTYDDYDSNGNETKIKVKTMTIDEMNEQGFVKQNNDNQFLGTWIYEQHFDNYQAPDDPSNYNIGATERGDFVFEYNGKGTASTAILYDDDIYEDEINTFKFTYKVDGNSVVLSSVIRDGIAINGRHTMTMDELKEFHVKQ